MCESSSRLGRVKTTYGVEDKGEVYEGNKHHVELLESREDSTESLQTSEQSLDLVSALVHGSIVFPRRDAGAERWHYGNKAEVKGELPRLVALVCPVHQQVQRPGRLAQMAQQLAPLGRIVGLARRQGKRYGRSSIRGNHMNLGSPSAAGFANGLGAVFFRAPVPSGCTFTMVLSKATASILIRTI